jgi:heme oxygenase (biliverdin-IX-beta and delta-forming)
VILEVLKSATAGAHASLETRLHIARPAPSLGLYRLYLSGMHGFTAPLEAQLRSVEPRLPIALELEKRCKAHLLEADLAALQARSGAVSALPRCEALPRVDVPGRALGALYVLEGSTLGARWLLRHLAPVGIEPATRYLRSYGDALGPMWERMRATLVDYHERHRADEASMVAAAVETFQLLDAWLVRAGAARASLAA